MGDPSMKLEVIDRLLADDCCTAIDKDILQAERQKLLDRQEFLREQYKHTVFWSKDGSPMTPLPVGDVQPEVWSIWAQDTLRCVEAWPGDVAQVEAETRQMLLEAGVQLDCHSALLAAVDDPALRLTLAGLLNRPDLYGSWCYVDGAELWVAASLVSDHTTEMSAAGSRVGLWWVIRA